MKGIPGPFQTVLIDPRLGFFVVLETPSPLGSHPGKANTWPQCYVFSPNEGLVFLEHNHSSPTSRLGDRGTSQDLGVRKPVSAYPSLVLINHVSPWLLYHGGNWEEHGPPPFFQKCSSPFILPSSYLLPFSSHLLPQRCFPCIPNCTLEAETLLHKYLAARYDLRYTQTPPQTLQSIEGLGEQRETS